MSALSASLIALLVVWTIVFFLVVKRRKCQHSWGTAPEDLAYFEGADVICSKCGAVAEECMWCRGFGYFSGALGSPRTKCDTCGGKGVMNVRRAPT
jgi:hypothetical protein